MRPRQRAHLHLERLTEPDLRGCPCCDGRGYWSTGELAAPCLACEGRGTSAAEEARLAEWEKALGP